MAEEDTNESTESTEDIDPIEIPGVVADLSTPFTELEPEGQGQLLDNLFGDSTDEEVEGLRADVAAEIMLLNENRQKPENRGEAADMVGRMEALMGFLDVVEAETGRREEARSELDARADSIAGRVTSEMQDGGDDEEENPAGDGEGGDEAAEGDGDGEGGGDGTEDEDEDEASNGDGGDDPANTPAATAATVKKPVGSGLAARLAANSAKRHGGGRLTGAQATVVQDVRPPAGEAERLAIELLGVSGDAEMRATGAARTSFSDVNEGADLGMEQLAEIFWGKRKALHNRMGSGVHDDRITLAQATLDWGEDRYLTEDAMRNFGIFASLRSNVETIVASGGNCAPAAPRYDIFRLAMPQSPVEDNLPVLGAPRGAIRFVIPPDFRVLRAGIGVTTDAQDAAGYGSGSGQATPKPCVHVDCPSIDEVVVTTVSQCIEFGNLTFETFPEFVAARLADLAVNFASVKEVFYLDKIDAGSTTQTYTSAYGVVKSILRHVAMASHNYRKRNNMDIDATLDWYGPDWLAVAMVVDAISDFSEGVNLYGSVSVGDVESWIAAFGLNVVWYYDSATGEGQAFTDLAVDGDPGNDFPTSAVWYLHAPGTFVRLDAGTLDLGIVRDSVLNRTNDLQIFAEQWIEVAKLGIEGIKGVSNGLCPSGAAPAAADLLTC